MVQKYSNKGEINMNTVLSSNMSKRDLVKAKVCTTSFKDYKEQQLKLFGGVIYDSESVSEETGEVEKQRVSAIKMKNENGEDEVIASISKTVTDSLDVILSEFEDEEIANGIDIVVKAKTSNSGREFLYIDLV